jgi:hypothetical protein
MGSNGLENRSLRIEMLCLRMITKPKYRPYEFQILSYSPTGFDRQPFATPQYFHMFDVAKEKLEMTSIQDNLKKKKRYISDL